MSVCEIIFGQSNPLAYYWSSSKRLFDAQAYQSALQSTEMALREKNQNSNEASSELPLDYWLSFNNFSYDKGRNWGLISQGVGAFFQFEIHFEPLAWDKRAIFDRFIGTAVYLFGRGVVLKEGDTLGASETEQFRVSYSKGSLKTLPRLTLKLEKIDQTLLSGEVA